MRFPLMRLTLASLAAGAVLPAITQAVTLTPIAEMTVRDAQLRIAQEKLTISLTLTNEGTPTRLPLHFGLRLISDGARIHESVIANDEMPARRSESFSITAEMPTAAPGRYDAYILVKTASGITLAIGRLGEFSIAGETLANERAHFDRCDVRVGNSGALMATCALSGTLPASTTPISYTVHEESRYGRVVASGQRVARYESDELRLALQEGLPPGRYALVLENGALGQASRVFTVAGSWARIDIVSVRQTDTGTYAAKVKFSGNGEEPSREFRYWITNRSGEVCTSGALSLENIAPPQRSVEEHFTGACSAPALSGILYTRDEAGTIEVLDTVGEQDVRALLSAYEREQQQEALMREGAQNVGAGLGLLVLAGLGWFLLRRLQNRGGRDVSGGATAALVVALALPQIAGAATFLSAENESYQFTVNLSEYTYRTDESVTFAFEIVDLTTGEKPEGASVSAWIDGNAPETIVSESDTGTTYEPTIAGKSEPGSYALNFSAPGLCGSAFDYSLFGSALFGAEPCEFSVPIEIRPGIDDVGNPSESPNTPSLSVTSGDAPLCVVDQESSFGVVAFDPQDDGVYYELDWSDITGSVDERLPASGYAPSGQWQYATRTITSETALTLRARAIDANGNASSWASQLFNCDTPCTVCNYGDTDGQQSADITLTATPSVVPREGGVTSLSYTLTNVDQCLLEGENGDAWDWDTLKVTSSLESSALTERTIFTLACKRLSDGSTTTAQTTVTPAPIWREF